MDKEAIQDFLTYVIDNQLPEGVNQEQCGKGKHYWNADFWTMEVAAYLIQETDYEVPERFKGNRNCDPNRMKHDAEIKKSVYENLQKFQLDGDALLICEVGRGLDILMANMVKKWRKIYCYDQVNYTKYLSYFSDIEFFHISTAQFDPSNIPENVTMIMNHSLYKPFENDNIIHAIIDGEISW